MLVYTLPEMNHNWRSAVGDIPIRLMILRRTKEIIETVQLPCEPDVFEDTLQQLVPKLEAELYRSAVSLEEYGDPRTVKQRLEGMAPHPGHVRPLEALWLQALLTAHPTSNRALHVQNPQPLPMYTVDSLTESQNEDAFTRSLLNARAFLDRYDAVADRIVVEDQRPEQQMPQTIPYRRPLDLKCRERMDDVMESF